MEKTKHITKRFYAPGTKKLEKVVRSMSPTEWIFFMLFYALLAASTITLLVLLNFTLIEKVPAPGGKLTEGMIGTPRFINPLLASSDSDRSLTSLIYAGLMKTAPDGSIVPELAERVEISEDGLTYTFTIKEGARFHDGVSITSDDIIFTIERAVDDRVQSPRQAGWSGVTIEKIDNKTIQFTLNEAFGSFLRNTTLGIMPKHLWEGIEPSQTPFSILNIEPIGAGPYKIKTVHRNDSGILTSYVLEPFDRYLLGTPFIKEIIFKFYQSENDIVEAYITGEIESLRSISSQNATNILKRDSDLYSEPLPRIFGIFFNQSKNRALLDSSARKAISAAIDREVIIQDVLGGFGKIADMPFPSYLAEKYDVKKEVVEIQDARDILASGGWKFDNEKNIWTKGTGSDTIELSLSLTTSNVPELEEIARLIIGDLQKVGIQAKLEVKDASQLAQDVIRPREYEALLFGMVIMEPSDLLAFWHSAQRNDPGLNISLYTNIEVDRALRKIRETSDKEDIQESLRTIEKEISKDTPAVFIYAPDFIYIFPKKIQNVELGILSHPGDRFFNVHQWFIETNREWRL